MKVSSLFRSGTRRWIVVAIIVIALFGLGEFSRAEAERERWLGLHAQQVGDDFVVTWVQPAGWAWDAGIRPGAVVVEIDGRPLPQDIAPVDIETASTVRVTASTDESIVAPLPTTAAPTAPLQRASFLITAICFVLVGAVVFILAADLLAAGLLLLLATSAAVVLEASVGVVSGAPWALATVYIGVLGFAASTFLLFLVFPVNRLKSSFGYRAASVCIGLTVLFAVLYPWVVTYNPSAYDLLQRGVYLLVIASLMGASALVVAAAFGASPAQAAARRVLGLVALGTVAGLAPFSILSLGPFVVGLGYLLSPEVAILSLVLLPASIGAAVLSRQFLGIERLVRRGLVALTVWFGLLGLYTMGLDLLHRAVGDQRGLLAVALESTILSVAIVAGTFPFVQHWLRERIERVLFHDVYDYAATLQQFSGEVVRLNGVEAIARHVLERVGKTLDLSWATIALGEEAPPPRAYRWGAVGSSQSFSTSEEPSRSESGSVQDYKAECRLAMPLVSEGQPIGTLLIGPKRHDLELSSEDEALIATLGPLLAAALQSALLLRRLEVQVARLAERENSLAALSAQLMNVQEEERRRIALDIHDDPLQRAILLTRELTDSTTPRARRWQQQVDEIIDSLRAICTDLRPPVLDDFGLVAGLEWLVDDFRARSDIDISLTVENEGLGDFGRLPSDLELALYRVAQEALNNCMKHSRASHVTMNLARGPSSVQLRVSDNGRGRGSATAGAQSPNLGMLGMRERLRPWSGDLSMYSENGSGTVVLAEVPMEVGSATARG